MCELCSKSSLSRSHSLEATSTIRILNSDFPGPLPNSKYLLLAIDQYSRFPVVEIVSSTSANCTISALEKMFSEHGLP